MDIFKCPVCGEPLVSMERVLTCRNRHSFDRSHDNYVNLLPGNRKNSKDPGDSKEMMESRREFLNKGYYAEFSDKLNEIILGVAGRDWQVVLDSGCGEGYYIANLKNAFSIQADAENASDRDDSEEFSIYGRHDGESGRSLQNKSNTDNDNGKQCTIGFYGMDISKHAIKYAVKRDKAIGFFVGSSFDIPVCDKLVDCVIRNFAPGDNSEFYRILRKDGYLVIITPGEDHLYELKAALYEKPRRHERTAVGIDGFTHVARQEKRYTIALHDNSDIKNLISMTPYYWSIHEQMRNHLNQIKQLETGLHFIFDVYRKA